LTVWAIVVAAGTGSRFGGAKQFAQMDVRRVVDRAVAASRAASRGVVVVVPADRTDDRLLAKALAGGAAGSRVVAGGATRSESVRAGLAAVPPAAEIVVVHDAARPYASPELFEAVVAAVRAGADGAVPGLAVSDTVKRMHDGRVVATLDRSDLVVVQTPQAFAAAALRRAHAGGGEATDDAALVEAAGGRVVVVAGEAANTKITHRSDLVSSPGGAPPGMTVRVGLGFDVHPFSDDPSRPLVLGGVRFPGARGLAGHSDADVVAHAVGDALLGAAGLGDLGRHFPDTGPSWAGADSLAILARVMGLVGTEGWSPGNVDCTVLLEAPRLAPHRDEMSRLLEGVVGADVGIKATRAEGLGAIGRGEGVACWAVALIERR